MRANAASLLLAIVVALTFALGAIGLRAGRNDLPGRVVAVPKTGTVAEFPIEKLNRMEEERFRLAYEARRKDSVQVMNTSYPVTLHGTNHNYAALMGLDTISGSYLTESAQKAEEHSAVLGERAAQVLFGSVDVVGETLRIGNELYLIIGVIKDAEEKNAENHLYVPVASLQAETVQGVLTLTGSAVTREHILSALQEMGVQRENLTVLDLGKSNGLLWQRALFLALLLGVCASAAALLAGIQSLRGAAAETSKRLLGRYPLEVLRENPKLALRFTGSGLAIAAGAAALLSLSIQALRIALGWKLMAKEIRAFSSILFAERLESLQRWLRLSDSVFAVSLVLLGLWILLMLPRIHACFAAKQSSGQDAV